MIRNYMLLVSFIFLVCLLFIPISFAQVETYEKQLQSVNQNLILDKSFSPTDVVSWSCKADQSLSVTMLVDSCFCISLNGGVGVGHGNIISCLNQNSSVTFDGPLTPFKLTIDYTSDSSDISPPTLVSNTGSLTRNSVITCQNTMIPFSSNRMIYTFFNPLTAEVFYRGSKDSLELSSTMIASGDSLSCLIGYYNGGRLIGTAQSENILSIADSLVAARYAYIAPGFPRVGETIYCHGFSDYSFSTGAVEHHFVFKSGETVLSESVYVDNNPSSSTAFIANYTLLSSDVISTILCEYSVKRNADESRFNSQSVLVSPSTPSLPIITFIWNIYRPSGVPIMVFHNADARKIVEFRSSGDVLLGGYCFETTDCSGAVHTLSDGVLIDSYGNLCVSNGCQKQTTCLPNIVTLRNSMNEVVISYGNGNFCYVGNLFEEEEI